MFVDSEGYPTEGHKRMHVIVAERALGKPLPKQAEVHHVNEDRGDYRNCNLIICENRAYHSLLHYRTRALDEAGNSDAMKCGYCGQWDTRNNPDMRDRSTPQKAQRYWHQSCFNKRSLERYHERHKERGLRSYPPAKTIQEARRLFAEGWRINAIAKNLGFNRNTISKWVRGLRRIKVEPMSKIYYIQCSKAEGTAIFCDLCDGETHSGYYDGPAAIEKHNEEYPEHQRITWLRREAA